MILVCHLICEDLWENIIVIREGVVVLVMCINLLNVSNSSSIQAAYT